VSPGNAWLEAACRNLLPRSAAKTLHEAIPEWDFLNRVQDYGDLRVTCELCEQEDLRWHYEISNHLTHYILQIGSRCIIRFNVAIFDENGRRVDRMDAEKQLAKARDKYIGDSCIKALTVLVAVRRAEVFRHALEYYMEHNALTPKFAYIALSTLRDHRIPHRPDYFKITLRKLRRKDDLAAMDSAHVHVIWPALSRLQRDLAIEYGHTAPVIVQTPVRHMTDKAGGHSYEALIANKWTDALLVEHGLMAISS